ncbi:sensor histidine kinase [Micromonospora coxensis]|uniref:histidine kinase n=1 Tax=Micromonospora coxensis TaxID=356852 RepID=A0A1C5JNJ2_9ACTN|nr:histidine kinase [Micromonospora coxensis]SCG71901.1 Signal transduction histidine kinase [Micromonospora coxensis]
MRDLRRWTGDLGLWAVLAAPVAYARLTPPHERWIVPLLGGSLLLLAVAVVVGRRLPAVAVLLVLGGSVVDGNFVFALLAFSYLAGWRGERATPAAALYAAVAGVGTVLHLAVLDTGMATWFLLSCVLLGAGVLPWLVGRYRRQHQALTLAGWEHAEAVEREQQGAAERIRLRERARIAQDMHDSLGHELSLIALRAAALEVAGDLDDRHRVAAGELRASVAAATERLHRIIGVLREADAPATTRPVGESVADLVDGAREAGMAVRTRLCPEAADLPEPAGQLAHRVVREALTNAARYAPGAPVTVTLDADADADDDGIRVRVVNAPPPAGPLPGPASHGSGLLALTEGVRLVGGALHAGPTDDGGFAVSARLPRTAGFAATPDEPTAAGGPADVGGCAVSARPPRPAGIVATPDGPTVVGGPTGPAVVRPGRPALAARQRMHAARRDVRRSLLAALGAPPAVALLLCLVYYPVATADAVLDASSFAQMRIGAPRAELSGLPRRQVEPPPDEPAPAPGTRCEYYTDGNFPLAQPTWRLCFADGRLTSKGRTTT